MMDLLGKPPIEARKIPDKYSARLREFSRYGWRSELLRARSFRCEHAQGVDDVNRAVGLAFG